MLSVGVCVLFFLVRNSGNAPTSRSIDLLFPLRLGWRFVINISIYNAGFEPRT